LRFQAALSIQVGRNARVQVGEEAVGSFFPVRGGSVSGSPSFGVSFVIVVGVGVGVGVGVTSLRSVVSFQFTACRILSSSSSRSLDEEEEDGAYFGW